MRKYLVAIKNPVNEKNLAYRLAVADKEDHARIFAFNTKTERDQFIKDILTMMPDLEYTISEEGK